MGTPQKLFAGIGFGIVTLAAITGWLSGVIALWADATPDADGQAFIGLLTVAGIITAISIGRSFGLLEGYRRAFALGATLTIGIGGTILLLTLATPFTTALLMTLGMPVLYGLFAAAAKPKKNW